jgi:cephalosporin hydroxylase
MVGVDAMNPNNEFSSFVENNLRRLQGDTDFRGLSNVWVREAIRLSYGYNFTWLGRPIIQFPQDIYVLQELIWTVRPDIIIETGIAHGGSLILSASMLAMLDYCDAVSSGKDICPTDSSRKVVGIDIDIRAHNRTAIEDHPMSHLINLIEGSSIDTLIVETVKQMIPTNSRVLVMLDSNHTHDHVFEELKAYAPLVTRGSYCIVMDSSIEVLPVDFETNRPWCRGNSPASALHQYLRNLQDNETFGVDGSNLAFEIDKLIESKITITGAIDGFLKRL